MYTTFLLRALGYSDAAEGDFTYDAAIDFGETIGLVDYANCNESAFLRDHVAAMSLTALNTDVKEMCIRDRSRGGEAVLRNASSADGDSGCAFPQPDRGVLAGEH